MQELLKNPAFVAYALTTSILCLNIYALWGYSGAVRGGTKTTLNPEDATTVSKGAEIVPADPPAVARVLRAHTNAMANSVPFMVLGLLYVLLGASGKMAWIVFGTFTAFRVIHSFAYVGGKQPWRTLSFAIAGLVSLFVAEEVLRASIALL